MNNPSRFVHIYNKTRCGIAKTIKGRHRMIIRNRHKKVFSFIGVIIWMAVIFINSAMTGSLSSNFSMTVINAMETVVDWLGLGNISDGIKQTIESDIFHTIVRKMAHFVEFGILALFLVNWFKRLDRLKETYLHIAGIAIVASAVYAVTDEIHQIFVPGRAFSPWDILIDTAGALLFATLAYLHIKNSQAKVRR